MEGDSSSYEDAADFLNASNVAVVSLQHECGIYGGTAGSFILRLMRRLKMPVVTTLHTALREPNANQRIVMEEVVALSDRLITVQGCSPQSAPAPRTSIGPAQLARIASEPGPSSSRSAPRGVRPAKAGLNSG